MLDINDSVSTKKNTTSRNQLINMIKGKQKSKTKLERCSRTYMAKHPIMNDKKNESSLADW